MLYLLSLDEIRASVLECLSEDVSMPLRLCMLVLSADRSFGSRPPTPKWTFSATQEGRKREQPMAAQVLKEQRRKDLSPVVPLLFHRCIFRRLKVLLCRSEHPFLLGWTVVSVTMSY